MNYAQIKDALAANLGGEEALDLHTPDRRTRAIQQAYRDITLDQEIGQGAVTLTLPALQSSLTLPSASLMISNDGVTVRGSKLLQVNIEDLAALRVGDPDNLGGPSYYAVDTERGGPLELYPRSSYPTAVTVNFLSRMADLVSDTDQPWGGRYETFHNLIPMRAAHILFREKGSSTEDMQASRFWLSEYDRELDRLKRFMRREEGGTTILRVVTSNRVRRRRWMDE